MFETESFFTTNERRWTQIFEGLFWVGLHLCSFVVRLGGAVDENRGGVPLALPVFFGHLARTNSVWNLIAEDSNVPSYFP